MAKGDNETRIRTNLYLSQDTREALTRIGKAHQEDVRAETDREPGWAATVQFMAQRWDPQPRKPGQ